MSQAKTKPCQDCGSTRFLDHKDFKKVELCVSCNKLRAKK